MGRNEAMRPAVKVFILLATLGGGVYSLINATGTHLLCLTEGCRIYAGYGLFGISFYSFGAAGFFLLFLLALLYPRRPAPWLLWPALLTGLLLDILFLAWQSLFWPCLSCLAAAAFLGLATFGALLHCRGILRRLLAATAGLWLVFFFYVGLSAAREIAFHPWPVYGKAEAPVKVFFSPECPACREAVREILENSEAAPHAAFYPIAKNPEDRRRLAAFLQRTGGNPGQEEFLALFEQEISQAPPLPWSIELKLLANKSALARTGAASVPLVLSPGLVRTSPPLPDFAPPAHPPLFPGGTDSGCSAFEEKPCD